jgi:hypothetical protein
MQTRNLADLYDIGPLDWSAVTDRLDRGFGQAPGSGGPDRHSSWLSTINPDGSPHVTGIGALWVDGAFWLESGTALTAEFSAPSAGPPPWHVYRIDVHAATALATTGDGGATRWTF